MKKFKLMMMAGLLALAGSAQADEVSVLKCADITVDDAGKAELVIEMDYETTETLVGLNFTIVMPEGANIDSKKDTNGSRQSACTLGDIFDDEVTGWLTIKESESGFYLFNFIDQSDKTPLVSTKGTVITIPVNGLTKDAGKGMITKIGLSNDKDQGFVTFGGGDTIKDVEFFINPGGVGINDIQAADATAPAYNLQGVRVNNAAKGLIIRDGKKMMVK
jgi:hypothetical protein